MFGQFMAARGALQQATQSIDSTVTFQLVASTLGLACNVKLDVPLVVKTAASMIICWATGLVVPTRFMVAPGAYTVPLRLAPELPANDVVDVSFGSA